MAQKNRATPASLPAPVGGWNDRDSIADMDAADAVTLTNFFPSTTVVDLRFGFSKFATGFPAQVETIIPYQGASSSKLFGIAGTSVYNASAGGVVATASVTGLTNARWQYINVATPGGVFIEMVNGSDAPRTYDGSAWASPAITGVTAANLIGINLFKNRVWFVEKATLKAWYLPVQSIAGAATALDLSSFCPHGGYLMAMGTWTIDAGYGVDDLAVFITSNGDCLVYRGTDPSSTATWALVGAWWLGSPIGRRCFVKYKGDLLLITQDGLMPLSEALQSSRVNPQVALTDKIQRAVSQATTSYGANFGWSVLPFPQEDMVILNVPIAVGNQQQYVMNSITGSWCNFTGWPANVFELYNDSLYFGGTNYIAKAWDTFADAGQPISWRGLQAFNYFGSKGQLKRFTMMRPTFYVSSPVSVNGQMNVDFDQSAPTASLSITGSGAGVWDTAVWDAGVWGGDLTLTRNWQGTPGIGYCGAPNIAGSTVGIQFQWVSTDVVMEAGAII